MKKNLLITVLCILIGLPAILQVSRITAVARVTPQSGSVTLDGSKSYDPDGKIIAYRWQLVSGARSVRIQTPAGVRTVVSNLRRGFYIFKLTVTDNRHATGSDTVTVTVK